MRSIAAALVAFILLAGPALAADDYVVTLQVLNTKGEFEEMVVTKATPAGVSLDECSMRRDAYWREDGPMWEATAAKLREDGGSAEVNVTCKSLADLNK